MSELAFLKSPTLLAIFCLLFGASNCQQNPYLQNTCGVLHSLDNFSGDEFPIRDHDQSVNLADAESVAGRGWNTTGSITISSRCQMEICNDTYFDGMCHSLGEGSHSLVNLTTLDGFNVNSTVASARCVCQKECKCSDIFMKKSSCARAYLKGGCRTCHALYADLRGSKKYFPEEFDGKVTALRLRKGCSLSLYSEEDFDGDEDIIESEIVEDFQGKFKSYECHCNNDTWTPKPRPPRPADFPPLIDIPSSVDDIIKLLNNKTLANHPGLRTALASLKNGRSAKNVYILLLGSTGAGKSSAVNILFDNPTITKVGDVISTTTDIHEFRIPVPVDELGIANSELRIIDTPGLGDTRGVEQDAKFLATLDAFLSNHEELKDRLPNVVLVFHKFNDNRFGGTGAAFVKMLRGLDFFRGRIMDENYSNIIFVLSHFCSVTNQIKRKPDDQLKQFKMVIENYSLFPRPTIISVAENKADEQDLPMVNGYWKLPNNEYYPRNLFEKMELATEKGGDLVGQSVIRTAFRDSEDFNVSSSTFKLLDNKGSKVEHFLKILTGVIFDIKNTEISQLLSQTWDEHVDASLKRQFRDSLPYLQKSLNIRNINKKEDIPKTATAILELLTALKHDRATRTLLDKALNIKPPVFRQNTIAGHGYNVFKDSYLPTSPFKLHNLQQSDIGFMIPNVLSCKLERSTSQNFFVFDNQGEYIQHRLHNLGIEGKIDESRFKGIIIKPGHNIKDVSFKNNSCSLSATRDFKLFEFTLNDRPELSKDFVDVVKSLPPFNQTDHGAVEIWNNFFNEYGTHVVRSVYGGGSIRHQLSSDKPFNQDMVDALFGLMKFEEYNTHLSQDVNGTKSNSTSTKLDKVEHSVSFQGGDIQYYATDFTHMSIEDADRLLTNWQKSLKFNPTVLSTEMKLVPMSQVVKRLGRNYSVEIEQATLLLFNSSLIHIPPIKNINKEPGLARDETPFMTQMLVEQRKSNERMQELLMEIKRIEAEKVLRQQKLDQQRLEWEIEKERFQQEFQLKQLEAQRHSEAARLNWTMQMELNQRQHRERIEEQNRIRAKEVEDANRASTRRMEELMKEMTKRNEPESKPWYCFGIFC